METDKHPDDIQEKDRDAGEENVAEKTVSEQGDDRIRKRNKIISILLVTALVIVSVGAIPTLAWFYGYKQMAVYIPISAPESLYIGTGQEEDIRYLYFSGIDVTDEAEHKDYVISVSGEGIASYKIQIGSTTNNQFTYSLYMATTAASNEPDVVKYVPADSSLSTTYYKTSGGAAIAGCYLNEQAAEEILANPAGVYHNSTYGSYTSVQKYAEPLYWQTLESRIVAAEDRSRFVHYYILRVGWDRTKRNKNDRETDVICIAAKVG